MEHTRILLVAMPRMLRDIVAETLVAEPDLEVVGEVLDVSSLPCWPERGEAHLAIVGSDNSSLAAMLLEEHPRLKVIALTSHGRESWFYELRPRKVYLGETSPENLIEAIRKATRERPASAWWGS